MSEDQTYYWTPEWQEGEREADADIAAGRVERFATMEDALAWLQENASAIDRELTEFSRRQRRVREPEHGRIWIL